MVTIHTLVGESTRLTFILVGFNPLQGVLGKTSGRSYKAAPRQLLQVDATPLVGSPTSSPQLHEADPVNHTSEPQSSEEPVQPSLDKPSRAVSRLTSMLWP